jgi:8-oxo-dGTP diphosphatase
VHDAQGRILLAQRPSHKHLAFKWEFAGGKVEPREHPHAALIREIREELGCDIVITDALPVFDHDYGTIVITMMPFLCSLSPGSPAPHPHEHVAVKWVSLAELKDYDLAPADLPIVDMLRDRKRGLPWPSV